ncbi:class II aldolase/adducin family protein [Mesorhizobium sp. SB112]|uniref:class II aldolase/adducin family protein n=1 Tax=Mesorhizobium sp. SB112 TaxID=3151853 RepID=UPI0032642818
MKMNQDWSDSNTEQGAREDLAAAYQLAALFGWDDSIYTHFSMRVPGTKDHFLINPFGLLFSEITASSLVKIDTEGNKVEASDYDVNPAGFTIHSAIHMARHDAACVIHTHTIGGVGVSSLEQGLQPTNQWAFQFYNRVAYHDFEGLALNLEERERIVQSLGPTSRSLILRNHGLLTVGRTVSEAFILMHNLERACRVQLAIEATGQQVRQVSLETREHTARQFERGGSNEGQADPLAREWYAFRRQLEMRFGTSYLS